MSCNTFYICYTGTLESTGEYKLEQSVLVRDRARSDEQGFFAKYLHAFVSVFQNKCHLKRFSSVWVAEWPPFGKKLPARLAICSHCILSICNIYLFPALVLRAGFAF